jgi:hypothetical protein
MACELVVEESTIVTRRRAERLAEEAISNHCSVLNLASVGFVSRSVADELVHQREQNGLELRELTGDVEVMVNAITNNHEAIA